MSRFFFFSRQFLSKVIYSDQHDEIYTVKPIMAVTNPLLKTCSVIARRLQRLCLSLKEKNKKIHWNSNSLCWLVTAASWIWLCTILKGSYVAVSTWIKQMDFSFVVFFVFFLSRSTTTSYHKRPSALWPNKNELTNSPHGDKMSSLLLFISLFNLYLLPDFFDSFC